MAQHHQRVIVSNLRSLDLFLDADLHQVLIAVSISWQMGVVTFWPQPIISSMMCQLRTCLVKVILETGYYEELALIKKACQLIEEAGGHFVKTSSGFADSPYRNQHGETVGYTLEILKIMRESVSDKIEVKAAQGVRRVQDAWDVIELGVTRFGVSRTVSLMAEYDQLYG